MVRKVEIKIKWLVNIANAKVSHMILGTSAPTVPIGPLPTMTRGQRNRLTGNCAISASRNGTGTTANRVCQGSGNALALQTTRNLKLAWRPAK
jgi:hypothetical protein